MTVTANMSDTRYKNAEWLHEQYHENGLSQYEIADKCGVRQQTVSTWMKKHDIEARDDCFTKRVGVALYSKRGYQLWDETSARKQVSVHRLLAVAEYGFDAVCDMHVHHQNGVKWDNRPDNIELLTPSEHSTHHALERYDNGDTRYRDEEWLKEQYHDNGLTQRDIADKCGVSHRTVSNWMEKHGIERRDPSHNLRSDKPTGQLTLDDTRKLEGAQPVNQ